MRVWEALRKRLPAGWSAWHSLRLRNRSATFGEGDFVLAHPALGILILEVKGGQVEERDGRWMQNGRPLDVAPLEQAHAFRNLLLSRFKDKGIQAPSIGQAPCFPDTVADDQPTEDDLNGILVTGHHLTWFAESLPALAARAIPPARRVVAPGWLEALHAMWGDSWLPSLSLGGRVKEAAVRRLSLDEAQLEVLEGLLENDRVLIQGGAGSGKTLLAAEASRRLAAEGRKVLLLCFTTPLRKWLAARLEGSGIEVHTVSDLARRMEELAGRAPPPGTLAEGEIWTHAFASAAEVCEPRWDAVVVDEAQDLQPEAWRFAEALARGRRLWAFHDPGQGYWPERSPPRELFGSTYRLPRQQRCPPGVQALADRCLGQPFDERALAEGRADGSVASVVVPEGGEVTTAVAAEVERLLGAGLRLGDIGVVSLRGQTAGDAAAGPPVFGPHASVRAEADDMEDRLVADTFLRWKGLERPAILVTELPEAELRRLPIRLNVALTRATVAVRLVGSAAALARILPDRPPSGA